MMNMLHIKASWDNGGNKYEGHYYQKELSEELMLEVENIRRYGYDVNLKCKFPYPEDINDLNAIISGKVFQVNCITVHCRGKDGDDPLLKSVSKLPFLDWVIIHGNSITDDGVKYLVDSPGIKTLVIYSDKLTNKSLRYFMKIKGLNSLDLQGSPMITRWKGKLLLWKIKEKWLL